MFKLYKGACKEMAELLEGIAILIWLILSTIFAFAWITMLIALPILVTLKLLGCTLP